MGSIGTWMRDQPSHVKEDMAFFQGQNGHRHTYFKRDSDKLWNGVSGALFAVTGIIFVQGFVDMIRGTGKKVVA